MRVHHFASLLALALPLCAQTEVRENPAKPEVETDKMWRVESSGIGG